MGSWYRKAFLAAACALVVGAPAGGSTIQSDWKAITTGLQKSVKDGRLDPDTAATYRGYASQALAVMDRIPEGRARDLAFVVHEVAVQAPRYDGPRSLALFSMLGFNADYFAAHPLPRGTVDVADDEGVMYRYFPRMGFQLHPLADFAALNARVTAEDTEGAETLALALLARGEPAIQSTLRFEYFFPFGGGKPPWVSGMAQAVAAQSLARTAQLTGDTSLMAPAAQAYGLLSRWLVRPLPEGPWVKLYAFSNAAVLNAQLQTVLSLQDYADISGDQAAAQLADDLQAAAAALLPHFDTGYWSYYSLAKDEAPLNYHRFVVQLLTKLGQRTGDATWVDAAARFSEDLVTPPEVAVGALSPAELYPVPADAFRDAVAIPLSLTKISWVTVRYGSVTRTFKVPHGRHAVRFSPGRALAPGSYAGTLTATDLAGNAVHADLPEIAVAWDTTAPDVEASLEGRTLRWQTDDPGTPWLRLTVRLRAGGKTRWLQLGRRGLNGSARLRPPAGGWAATLVAANSAGKQATVELGTLR